MKIPKVPHAIYRYLKFYILGIHQIFSLDNFIFYFQITEMFYNDAHNSKCLKFYLYLIKTPAYPYVFQLNIQNV